MRLLLAVLLIIPVSGCGSRSFPSPDEMGAAREKEAIKVEGEWGAFFGDKRAKGCFVIRDLETKKTRAFNLKRAQTPLLPASTFKIPNTLIALDLEVVADRSHVFKWDGKKRNLESWERDHTLDSAFQHSVVPVYQEIARSIGHESMAAYVKNFGYGNEDISGGIDRFWLDGSLRISAVEQVDFLEKLYFETLPARVWSQRNVKEIMLHEKTERYVIRAKTGWALRDVDPVGWWVGWVEVDGRAHAFALNIELKQMNHAGRRLEIAKSILKSEGLLPD
ncbi:MAG: beta-lactamase class D [Planctomycetota bacterium]|jgi:beta-lactamase class D